MTVARWPRRFDFHPLGRRRDLARSFFLSLVKRNLFSVLETCCC